MFITVIIYQFGCFRVVVMGGDGTFADVVNSLVLRYQRESQVNVNDPGVKLAPMPIKVGIIPAGNQIANPRMANLVQL